MARLVRTSQYSDIGYQDAAGNSVVFERDVVVDGRGPELVKLTYQRVEAGWELRGIASEELADWPAVAAADLLAALDSLPLE